MLRVTTTQQLNSLRASQTSLTHTDEGIQRALQFINTLEVDSVEVPQIDQTASESVRQLLAALVNMREQMRQIAEQEKQRNWVSEGLAQFVEILRSHPSDMDSLYDTILGTLVKYLGANQGGLFVAQADPESSVTLQLVACYAYDRRKHLQKTVAVGEGLLGQCYLEQNLIYLTDLPTDYLSITSGLGQACPRVILLVPLKLNDQVLGVLELASFNPLEPYRIEFVTRLGESIAATISNVSTSAHTRQLLETAQQQSERLLTQEEEMRQNLEELSATQEQMRRREAETQNILLALEAVNDTFATVELTMQGAVLTANANFLTLMGYTTETIRGCYHRQFVDTAHAQSTEYAQFWENLNEGRLFSGEAMRLTKSGQPVWMRVSYAPVRNSEGLYYKVMVLAQDVTESRQATESAKRLSLVADNTHNAVVITDANGLIEYVNRGFEQMTGYTLAEVAGRKPGSFLQGPDTDPATVQRIRQKVAAQVPFYEEILNYGKSGETYWISLAINPVWDESGNLHKFIAIEADITDTKKESLDYSYKLEAIDRAYGVVEFDTQGHIQWANENFLSLVGYSLEEVVGQHHRLFMSAEDRESEQYRQFWQQLGEQGKFFVGEFRRIARNGETVWLKGSYNAVLDIQGKPYKVVKYAQDITAQKNLEDVLQKQSLDYSCKLAAIDKTYGVVEFDTQGNIQWANHNFLALVGYSLEELTGQHHRLLVLEEERDSSAYRQFWSQLGKLGQPVSGEFRRITKKGETVWLRGSYNAVLDLQGHPYKVVKYVQDITAQKSLEAAVQSRTEELGATEEELRQNLEELSSTREDLAQQLAESEALKREMLARENVFNLTTILSEADAFGTITYVNDKLCEVSQYRREELLGKPHNIFRHPDMPKALFKHLWKTIKKGEVFRGIVKNRAKDGTHYWVDTTISPVLDANGKPVKYIGVRYVIASDALAEELYRTWLKQLKSQ